MMLPDKYKRAGFSFYFGVYTLRTQNIPEVESKPDTSRQLVDEGMVLRDRVAG